MNRQPFNPYLPEGKYMPDGEPHVFGDRVYVYASHDRANGKRFCTGDYEVWSAPVNNLSDWTCKGVSLPRKNKFNKSGFKCMWAPDCVQGSDGKYYLYFCFGFENRICVARSDSPDGHFSLIGCVKHADGRLYGSGKGDFMCFDPAVFRDDDGSVYLYSGFAPGRLVRVVSSAMRYPASSISTWPSNSFVSGIRPIETSCTIWTPTRSKSRTGSTRRTSRAY